MGMRFRKSINIGGGFRINLSKNGIGYSWGVPGYRITKTSKGRTRKTYSIPGTNISYITESGKKSTKSNQPPASTHQNITETKDILDVGNIENYQSAEYSELLNAISNYKTWNLIANILIATILLIATPVFILTTIIGIILKIYVKTQMRIPLEYTFDDASRLNYESEKSKWLSLKNSSSLWQLISSAKVSDKKYAAGADNLIERKKILISESTPKYFKADMKFVTINLKKEKLYLMPDKILIEKGKKIGAISYSDINITSTNYQFIETENLSKDAEVIGTTWTKVNKDGSPDKRFKGNRQIPICKYGLITLSSTTGMDIRICFSNNALVNNFK